MIRARIVPATVEHAHAIAANPRKADLDELWACSRSNPLDAMLRGMERTAEPFTAIYNDRPACMFGASPFSIMGGMGSAWMIGSSVLNQHGAQKDLLRLSEPVVEYMQDQFPNLLYNFVDQRNIAAIRWLRWLGFQFSDPIAYGVDGLPFLPFYRRRGA
ncbi:hypothetical protein 10KY502B_gene0056 [Xanthomonas phage 10KY502B]|nr:hypothetical protein 10KY502B_gene0056 [Xanthomonas phage 10KY502B]